MAIFPPRSFVSSFFCMIRFLLQDFYRINAILLKKMWIRVRIAFPWDKYGTSKRKIYVSFYLHSMNTNIIAYFVVDASKAFCFMCASNISFNSVCWIIWYERWVQNVRLCSFYVEFKAICLSIYSMHIKWLQAYLLFFIFVSSKSQIFA